MAKKSLFSQMIPLTEISDQQIKLKETMFFTLKIRSENYARPVETLYNKKRFSPPLTQSISLSFPLGHKITQPSTISFSLLASLTSSVLSPPSLFCTLQHIQIHTSVGVGFFISLTAACTPKFIMPAFCSRAPKHAN